MDFTGPVRSGKGAPTRRIGQTQILLGLMPVLSITAPAKEELKNIQHRPPRAAGSHVSLHPLFSPSLSNHQLPRVFLPSPLRLCSSSLHSRSHCFRHRNRRSPANMRLAMPSLPNVRTSITSFLLQLLVAIHN